MPFLLLDPDLPFCRAVLSSLYRCAQARDPAAFLDDMRRWVVLPNGFDHRALLHVFLREEMAASMALRLSALVA